MKKRNSPAKKAADPHAQREAGNYENPIPSREYILEVLDQAAQPLGHFDLCDEFDLSDDRDIEALRRRLIAMERDGQLISNRHRAYVCVDKLDLVRGVVQGHKDGYGFVIVPDGNDIYLHNRQMRRVFSGDEVLVRLSGEYRGKDEGTIVEVVARNTHQLVGRFSEENGIQFVRPDNARISLDVMVPPGDEGKAKQGQFVVVEITQQPDKRHVPAGRVIEVMGDHMAPGMEIDVAIRSHGIPHWWPTNVTGEAEALPSEVVEADKKPRIDLRKLPFVTIDGEDARDFDDAVYCERNAKTKGWRLYVAIADVSHYVPVGSALDQEALVRGNSVYFPDFVVPMLPEAISNGLCSLNPHVDRLCMVCEMTVSAAGKVSGYQFYEGVIHSHARLTYTQVGAVIEAQQAKQPLADDTSKDLLKVLPQVESLHQLYGALRHARDVRGAIDFETVETRILFDEDRKIDRIVPVQRNDAHKLIEECMLAANVCAARFLEKHKLPALYRVHEGPKEEKLNNLRAFLGELGLTLQGEKLGKKMSAKPQPKDYQQLLSSIEGRPDAHLIQMVMLRSLSQAKYQPDNEGHFGLGYSAYAHFTSPIRRYPDLLVHRAIRSVIRSRNGVGLVKRALRTMIGKSPSECVQRVKGAAPLAKETIFPYGFDDMLRIGEGSSVTERRADDATREVTSWLKCEYLLDHVGDVFDGVVSAATGFGLFVELKDLYVEGLIHITGLPHDYYHFDAAHHRLVGERSGQSFRLGDELTVRVARVDLDERKVDFELVEIKTKRRKSGGDSEGKKPGGRSRKPRSGGKGGDKAGSGRKDGDRKPRSRKPSGKKSGDGASAGKQGAKSGGGKSGGDKPSGRRRRR